MFFIFVIDLATAFGALVLMLWLRYGREDIKPQLDSHLIPFAIITSVFILVFYIFNLYSFRFNKNVTELTSSFIKSLTISFVVSVLIFYIFGGLFKLTPKTNLVLFTIIFGGLDFYLRILIKRRFVKSGIDRKIILVREFENSLVEELEQNQNIGYKIIEKNNTLYVEEVINQNPDAVVIDSNKEIELEEIYAIMKYGISVYTINNFYEEVFQKVPTEKLEKEEVVDYLSKNRTIFNFSKRALDIILALVLLILTSPLFILTAILVKATSRGPVLIRQRRISRNEEDFILYKFRSMFATSPDGQSEKNGAVWTANNNQDPRITPIGRFIRKTHLDELPQLWNILKGNISFVGPRPERPEFVGGLKKDILYYDLRHSVKAGLTGWAQVNYKYGSSVTDAKEKLKYDFYYIKNRSIFFDFLIILKTVAELFRY